MCQVDIPDARPFTLKVVGGTFLRVRCDPAGLIEAFDFLTEDGAVIRQERRLVTLVPGMSELEGQRPPNLAGHSIEGRRRNKALLLALWSGLSASERAAFLDHVGLGCAA